MTNVLRLRRRDWTDSERVALSVLEQYCADKYVLECSHTDEGDPWCVVFIKGRHEILLHVAKLDRGYVAVSPLEHRSMCTNSFHDAIRFGLAALERTSGIG